MKLTEEELTQSNESLRSRLREKSSQMEEIDSHYKHQLLMATQEIESLQSELTEKKDMGDSAGENLVLKVSFYFL